MELFIIHQKFFYDGKMNNQWDWHFTDYEKAWKFYVKSVNDWEKDPLRNGYALTCDTDHSPDYHNMEYTNGLHKVAWTFTTAHTLDHTI